MRYKNIFNINLLRQHLRRRAELRWEAKQKALKRNNQHNKLTPFKFKFKYNNRRILTWWLNFHKKKNIKLLRSGLNLSHFPYPQLRKQKKKFRYRFHDSIPQPTLKKPPLIPQIILPEEDEDKKLYQGLFKKKKIVLPIVRVPRAKGKIFDFWGEALLQNIKPRRNWWNYRLRLAEYAVSRHIKDIKLLLTYYPLFSVKDVNKSIFKDSTRLAEPKKKLGNREAFYWFQQIVEKSNFIFKKKFPSTFFKTWQSYWTSKARGLEIQPVSQLVALAQKASQVRSMGYYSWLFYYSQGITRPRLSRWSRWRQVRVKKMKLRREHFFKLDNVASFLLINNKKRTKIIQFINHLLHQQKFFSDLGFIGLFMNILVAANLVTSGRKAYLLIKHGFYEIDGRPVRNPYISLRVGSCFNVKLNYVLLYFRYLKWLYTKNRILFPIPNYIEVSYKSLTFFIFRRPADTEKNLYPFNIKFKWLSTASKDFYKLNKNYFW